MDGDKRWKQVKFNGSAYKSLVLNANFNSNGNLNVNNNFNPLIVNPYLGGRSAIMSSGDQLKGQVICLVCFNQPPSILPISWRSNSNLK